MDLEEHHIEAKDKYFNATYGLWNALLTVNGIVLTVFSALSAIKPCGRSPFVLFIIVACAISSCLLIFNYLAMKLTYHRIFEFISNPKKPLTNEDRKRDIQVALWRNKAVYISETVTLILFILEVLCIAVFVWNFQ